MKRILVATDGSDHALKAAELGAELAAKMGAELHILAVAYRNRSDEEELREFVKIEHLEGGIGNAVIEIAKSHAEQAEAHRIHPESGRQNPRGRSCILHTRRPPAAR